MKLHADEPDIDAALAQRLIAAQFPHWAAQPIKLKAAAGTDNATFRLGADLCVRLPRRRAAVAQAEKEAAWLPRLAPHLPLRVPQILAMGAPGEGFPWVWSVRRWIAGETAQADRIVDMTGFARDLAGFITALRRIDARDGPAPGAHNFGRGVPLLARDGATRAALAQLDGVIDVAAARAAWAAGLAAPAHAGAPVWVHGDLSAGNLLVADGRLCGVIDFGGLGIGDPACDLMMAWSFFSGDARAAFRAALAADDAQWMRGRAWALSVALIELPYYRDTHPTMIAAARRTIAVVLEDAATGSGR